MRIPSGTTDRYIYFVAVDSTDLKTRETGFATWTVYRSRNGGTSTLWTTPTINETDATNMPGVYELLLDEDTTLTAGNDTEEMVVHITHAGMAPVTRTFELYRPETTQGNTLDVTATGAAGIDWANVENQSTSVNLSATTTNLVNTVTTYTGNTKQTGDTYALASGATGFAAIDTVVDAIKVKTDFLPSATAGAAGGVFIAGTNAATTITTALTTTFTGNLTGSVASVTGAVGSVTGSVGSLVGHTVQTGDSFARIGAAGASLTAIPWNAAWDAEVESEANDALIAQNLDHLVKSAVDTDFDTTVHADSVIAYLAHDGIGTGSSAYDRTTDSLEVIASNLTGAVLVDTTIATLASQTSFTLTTGSADDDAYNGCMAVFEDASTATQKAVGFITNYIGTSKTVTLGFDPNATFVLAATDKIRIFANFVNVEGWQRAAVDPPVVLTDILADSTAFNGADIPAILLDTGTDGVKLNATQPTGWADNLVNSAGQIIKGTVDTVTNTHTPTITEFQADDITEATSSHFNNRRVIFTSGALVGQAARITAYSQVGGIGQFTVTAMTEAPANNDTFIIV